MDVPIPENRRNVPPGLGGEHPQENPEGRWIGTPEISRLATHIRNLGIAEWRGRENRIQYARTLRRRLHTENLHPRYAPDAGKRRRKDGQFHGAGDVKSKGRTQSVGEDTTNILSDALWTFRRVGHGVGQTGFCGFS